MRFIIGETVVLAGKEYEYVGSLNAEMGQFRSKETGENLTVFSGDLAELLKMPLVEPKVPLEPKKARKAPVEE